MDTEREMDIRILEILSEHDELEKALILGQLGSRAKRMMSNGQDQGTAGAADQVAENAAGQAPETTPATAAY